MGDLQQIRDAFGLANDFLFPVLDRGMLLMIITTCVI